MWIFLSVKFATSLIALLAGGLLSMSDIIIVFVVKLFYYCEFIYNEIINDFKPKKSVYYLIK